jgi:hypothetical protein
LHGLRPLSKTVGAMAKGKAVVGYPNAFRGIPVVDRQHAIIAQTERQFATCLETVANDEDGSCRLSGGSAARASRGPAAPVSNPPVGQRLAARCPAFPGGSPWAVAPIARHEPRSLAPVQKQFSEFCEPAFSETVPLCAPGGLPIVCREPGSSTTIPPTVDDPWV